MGITSSFELWQVNTKVELFEMDVFVVSVLVLDQKSPIPTDTSGIGE